MTIPRTTSPVSRACAVLTAAVMVAGMAGCSGDKKAETTPTPSTTVPAVTAPPLPKVPVFAEKTPAGAMIDVKVVECPMDKGEQTAKLKLTNSTKKARDYSIMVVWLRNNDGTPLGSGLATVEDAAPGKEIDVTVKAKVVEKAERCALNVFAGTIKK